MIDLYLACVKLGVIFVPINILYRDRESGHILRDAEPRALVSVEVFDSPVPIWDPPGCRGGGRHALDRPEAALDGDAPAGIIYTSGTTGTSKGAVLTHNNFAANAINLLTCWQITAADRFLLALPLFHVHALGNGLHCWLGSGCRMRLLERFDHTRAAESSSISGPRCSSACRPFTCGCWKFPPAPRRKSAAPCACSFQAPRHCPRRTLEDFRALFGHTILERYGMSENLMNISNPYAGERRPGSVGLPLPGVSVRLVDGEIQLKGPNLFAGYWRRQEATRAAFTPDGWFRTGDLATCSPDGYYTLSGRKSDLIISGGFNIYPREIEEFLQEQPEIAEAAVVALADPVRGEVPVAYLVCRCDVDAADLAARCRDKLASFKIPRAFHAVDSLPRNAMGKIQKHLLK